MVRKNLTLTVIILVISAGGAGYYFRSKEKIANIPNTPGEEVVLREGESLLDTFFEKIKPADKQEKSNLKEYKDPRGILSITYPASWVVYPEQGRSLTGANFTPAELIARHAAEEQQFVRGLAVGAGEANETPENYFKKITAEAFTGQIEAADLTINGYPAYRVKGNINGTDYVVYILTHNNRVVYFNYRIKESEKTHQDDIQKSVDFSSYVADFEAVIASIKFLK